LAVFFGFRWIHTRDLIREIVIDDISAPPTKKLFAGMVDPARIGEVDLREFGRIILDKYEQIPLRTKLTQKVRASKAAVVVDSIRDINDVDHASIIGRPILTWSIDCPEPIIQNRLATRAKLGGRILKSASPVDRTAPTIQQQSDKVITNAGSLEELRWRVDDALFEVLRLK
jgi:dephospho-CoA kinase